MMGSEKRIRYALEIESFDDISLTFNNLLREFTKERSSFVEKIKLLPQLKEASGWLPGKFKGNPPCQERVFFTPDLGKLPILKCWPEDGGKFITLPMVHTNDSETGIRNVGMYRMQVFSENTLGMHWHRHKTGARHFAGYKKGQFPVAVALGGDPVYTYCATAPLPDGIDEYLLAGFLRNKPVLLTDCLTQPIQVPADSDIVIEGYIEKNAPLVKEGPFGDHTGFYSPVDLYPLLHVTCITHRKDAIYPATLVGIPPQEDKYMAIATEKIFLTPIKLTSVPEIIDLHLPEEGVGHNFAFVKIDKNYPGQAIKVAHALWGAGQMMFNKIMIITDADIELRDHTQVMKALKEHYLPGRDTHFSRGPLDVLDHAAPTCGYGGKILFDATKKLPEESGSQNPPVFDNDIPTLYFTYEKTDIKGLINILVDNTLDKDDLYTMLWIWGNNCDPIRDSQFVGGKLIMDSTTKKPGLHIREWPEMALSSAETINVVDEKWDKLNIGEIVKSPSLKYLKIS